MGGVPHIIHKTLNTEPKATQCVTDMFCLCTAVLSKHWVKELFYLSKKSSYLRLDMPLWVCALLIVFLWWQKFP